jgi:hypothetical protein
VQRPAECRHVERVEHRPPRDAGAHHAHRLAHRLEAELLLLVRDDHPPHALVPRRHDAPEVHVAPRQRLQLERDVLEHVRQVRPLAQPLDEASRHAPRARMLVQRRHRLQQPVDEARNLGGAHLLERPQPHVARDHRRQPPVVGAAQRTQPRHLKLRRIVRRRGRRRARAPVVLRTAVEVSG